MKEKLLGMATKVNVLTVASLILMGLSQMVSGKLSEEETRAIVRDEMMNEMLKIKKDGEGA